MVAFKSSNIVILTAISAISGTKFVYVDQTTTLGYNLHKPTPSTSYAVPSYEVVTPKSSSSVPVVSSYPASSYVVTSSNVVSSYPASSDVVTSSNVVSSYPASSDVVTSSNVAPSYPASSYVVTSSSVATGCVPSTVTVTVPATTVYVTVVPSQPLTTTEYPQVPPASSSAVQSYPEQPPKSTYVVPSYPEQPPKSTSVVPSYPEQPPKSTSVVHSYPAQPPKSTSVVHSYPEHTPKPPSSVPHYPVTTKSAGYVTKAPSKPSSPAPSATPKPEPQPGNGSPDEMLCYVNSVRAKSGKKPLKIDSRLMMIAKMQSDDNASRKQMTHKGIKYPELQDRLNFSKYKWNNGAENVAAGQPNTKEVMHSWVNSKGHLGNINSDQICFGYANTNNYWTQVFANGDACTSQTLPDCKNYNF